jgi:hypothetical protein
MFDIAEFKAEEARADAEAKKLKEKHKGQRLVTMLKSQKDVWAMALCCHCRQRLCAMCAWMDGCTGNGTRVTRVGAGAEVAAGARGRGVSETRPPPTPQGHAAASASVWL